MTTTLTLSTDTHFILMREYSAMESMEICKIKCTIVRVKVKGFWLLNLQLKIAKAPPRQSEYINIDKLA